MVEVRRSTIIDAPIDAVWRILRRFNDHDQWHPVVAESAIEGDLAQDQIGCVRRFRLQDGAELREQLLTLSDRDHSFTYCILDSPIPLIGYVAKVTLKRVTDGDRTFWDWRSSFTTPPGREAELAKMVGEGVYDGGIAAIRALVERGRTRPATLRGPITGQAIVVSRHGGPEELRAQSLSIPPPGPGEVRLRHTAIGINFIDVYVRTGFYPLLTPPGVPGMEAAGEVVDVGPDVAGLSPGDRVAYACPPVGAYATYRTMAAGQLVRLPDDISDEVAAASMLKGMSAEYLLRRTCQVRRGQSILVHSAAGGVGLILCQWAKHLGATVIGTVSTAEKARLARAHGCDHALVTGESDFVSAVRELTGGKGADVIYDGVGADTLLRSLAALAMRGHLVSYGQSAGPVAPIEPSALSAKSATLSRPVLFHYTADPGDLREIAGNLFAMIRSGIVRVAIHQRYPLAQAAEAHRALEARQTTGASILRP
jgi:NADPH:quinone reductase